MFLTYSTMTVTLSRLIPYNSLRNTHPMQAITYAISASVQDASALRKRLSHILKKLMVLKPNTYAHIVDRVFLHHQILTNMYVFPPHFQFLFDSILVIDIVFDLVRIHSSISNRLNRRFAPFTRSSNHINVINASQVSHFETVFSVTHEWFMIKSDLSNARIVRSSLRQKLTLENIRCPFTLFRSLQAVINHNITWHSGLRLSNFTTSFCKPLSRSCLLFTFHSLCDLSWHQSTCYIWTLPQVPTLVRPSKIWTIVTELMPFTTFLQFVKNKNSMIFEWQCDTFYCIFYSNISLVKTVTHNTPHHVS